MTKKIILLFLTGGLFSFSYYFLEILQVHMHDAHTFTQIIAYALFPA